MASLIEENKSPTVLTVVRETVLTVGELEDWRLIVPKNCELTMKITNCNIEFGVGIFKSVSNTSHGIKKGGFKHVLKRDDYNFLSVCCKIYEYGMGRENPTSNITFPQDETVSFKNPTNTSYTIVLYINDVAKCDIVLSGSFTLTTTMIMKMD